MADYFSRPLRLTRSEALALYLRAKALLGAPGLEEAPALASALAEARGGPRARGLSGPRRPGGGRAGGPRRRRRLRRRRRAARTARAPLHRILTRRAGRAHDANDRSRARVLRARATGTSSRGITWPMPSGSFPRRPDPLGPRDGRDVRATRPVGAGRALYTRSDRDIPVRLALGPSARWVMEYYSVEDARRPRGRPDRGDAANPRSCRGSRSSSSGSAARPRSSIRLSSRRWFARPPAPRSSATGPAAERPHSQAGHRADRYRRRDHDSHHVSAMR